MTITGQILGGGGGGGGGQALPFEKYSCTCVRLTVRLKLEAG